MLPNTSCGWSYVSLLSFTALPQIPCIALWTVYCSNLSDIAFKKNYFVVVSGFCCLGWSRFPLFCGRICHLPHSHLFLLSFLYWLIWPHSLSMINVLVIYLCLSSSLLMCPGLKPDPPREAQEKERQPSMFSLAPCRPLVHHLSLERPEDSLVWTSRPLAAFTTNYPSLPFLMSLLQLGVGWPLIKGRVKVGLSLSDRSAKAQISSEEYSTSYRWTRTQA